MKFDSRIIYLFLFLFAYSSICNAELILNFDPPKGWKVEHQNRGDSNFFSISHQGEETSLLMFSNSSAKTNPEESRQVIDESIEFYLNKAKERATEISTIIKIEQNEIIGKEFSGKSVLMIHEDDSILALFVISNGKTLIHGQFTGQKQKWETAANTLKSIVLKG